MSGCSTACVADGVNVQMLEVKIDARTETDARRDLGASARPER